MKEINLTVKRIAIMDDIIENCFVNKNYPKKDVEYLKSHNIIVFADKWRLTGFGIKIMEIIEEKNIYGGD